VIRAEICDRAARANAAPGTSELAKTFRTNAATLDPSRDLFIADALLKEANGHPDETLRELKTRNDSDTRSALLTTLIRQRGRNAALSWVQNGNLTPRDLNALGAMNLILTETRTANLTMRSATRQRYRATTFISLQHFSYYAPSFNSPQSCPKIKRPPLSKDWR
jgi:hypothetical protein